VCAIDGAFSVTAEEHGPASDPESLGATVAEILLRRDARRALATMPMAAVKSSP
jgi:hypothetical protein